MKKKTQGHSLKGLNKCKEGRFFFGQRHPNEAADDVTMSESVKVIARSRPLNEAERKMKTEIVLSMDTSKHQCTIRKTSDSIKAKKVFTFDGVYGSSSSTDKIYSGIVRPIVQGVLEGYNGTVFAYGQTSCGKTFTMEGVSEPETQTGIIPRCFKHILTSIQHSTSPSNGNHSNGNSIHSNSSHGNNIHSNSGNGSNSINSGKTFDVNNSLSNNSYGNSNHGNRTPSNNIYDNREYLLHVSFLEIYNEEIRDLLVKNTGCKLEIKEHPDKGMYVKGLSSITVDCYDDMKEILAIGSANRSVGATCMNTDSSRSHSIFIIDLEMSVYHGEGKEFFRNGKLNLVDLAGSERQGKSLASGERFREATRINLSLSALGNVISALVDGKIKHIPYRDSKLTRLLQDSLGGNSRTLMIACISPGANNYEETLTTLRYAKRAKNIKNRPRINEDPKDTLIKKYQEEIEQLKRIIAKEIEIPPHIALEIEEMRKKRSLCRVPQSPTTSKDKSLTTTTTTVEIQEIQTEILEERITKPQRTLGLKALSDLKAQLSIERRIQYETYQSVLESSETTSSRSTQHSYNPCTLTLEYPINSPIDEERYRCVSTSTDDLTSLQSLASELSSSDDDVFGDDWNIRENIMCREVGDGSSRSASPYIGDPVKPVDYAVTNKMPLYLDEEGPVPMSLCNLCLGVSFFGEKLPAKAIMSSS